MAGPAPCLILTGPTAVGKTATLLELQAILKRPIEVVSADAFQVYRGLDIGTAKPDPALIRQVPHHLINIRDLDQQFNLGDFIALAQTLIEEISARNALPLICGGTVYYIKHLMYGLPQAPPADPIIRAAFEKEKQNLGLPAMFQKLQEIDPVSAQRIDPADWYRICRSLEVWRTSGKTLSSYERQRSAMVRPALCIGLELDRSELVKKIDSRVRTMFDAGLAGEVANLLKQGFMIDDPGFRAIGYREFVELGAAKQKTVDQLNREEVIKLIATHTRQYAKRQMTFLRGIPDLHWLPSAEPRQNAKLVYQLIAERLPCLLT